MAARYEAGLTLAPGEKYVYRDKFTPNFLVPHAKLEMLCSSTRFVYRKPRMILGFIPNGFKEEVIPIRKISAISVDKPSINIRAVIGILILLIDVIAVIIESNISRYYTPDSFSVYLGLSVIIGLICIFTAKSWSIRVRHSGVGGVSLRVARYDKERLEQFAIQLENRVFSDYDQKNSTDDEVSKLYSTYVMQK